MAQILIVEDEANIRRVLRKILIDIDKSIIVSEAVDGVEAISMVSENTYDLILCDIKMPKKDGIEVLEYIQKVSPQTSTKKGTAPSWAGASALATYVKDGTNTASPAPIPHAISTNESASVPLAHVRA